MRANLLTITPRFTVNCSTFPRSSKPEQSGLLDALKKPRARTVVPMHTQRRISICRIALAAVVSLFFLLSFSISTLAQSLTGNQIERGGGERRPNKVSEGEGDAQEIQRRAFAVSLIVSVANEARSYYDLALRPRVLARAADVVWTSDPVIARSLFRRAWEEAEKGDAEDVTVKTKDNAPNMVIALRRLGGKDLRVEVLNLVARRDRTLAEEFLAKLKRADREMEQSKGTPRSSDGWSNSEVISKRLQAASHLLNEGQIQSALELATPGLNQVTANSINFLTDLRAKSPELADQRFAMLMARAELDPLSDANTVSGLSSYVFSPGFYITFSPDGSAVWTQPEHETVPPAELPATIRNQFFEVAGSILLRPLPPPDQDHSSSGRKGKYMIVKHLLPLFDRYAPDTAVALHAQLQTLAGNATVNNDRFSPVDSKPKSSATDALENMQDELDHAKTSRERDEIFAAAAVRLAIKGDVRARDIANKIDDSERRGKVLEYVDFEFIQLAIRKKDVAEIARLAKIGQIAHSQRAWAYTQAARLLPDSERETALEFLNEAIAEIQRIEDRPRDRAVLLVGVARRLLIADRMRAWDIMNEAVKAANQADNFSGENQISFSIGTSKDIKFNQIGGEESGLTGIFRLLAKDDLNRSVDLAKSFKKDAPRAAATLAIAGSLLDTQGSDNANN